MRLMARLAGCIYWLYKDVYDIIVNEFIMILV